MYRTADGHGNGFVPLESAVALESEWGQIENRGCEAIRHVLRNGEVDSGHKAAIIGLMALHLLRSLETLGRFLKVSGDAANKLYNEVATRDDYRRLIEDTGLTVGEAQKLVDRAIRAPSGFIRNSHAHFAVVISKALSIFVEKLSAGGLILRTASSLMLSDSPAFLAPMGCLKCESTVMFSQLDDVQRCDRHQGTSALFSPADWQCLMPLAPTLLAIAGPRIKDESRVLPAIESLSDSVNVMQCRRAQARIAMPPNGENRDLLVVGKYASFAEPVSNYVPVSVPDSARWRM